MRVFAIGLRGFPNVQGGVETHAEHIYPLLVALGCQVEVAVRTPYVPAAAAGAWKGVTFRRIWSPKSSGLEAIVHTFLSVLYAGITRPDVVHIHAIGPALMVPLARLLGLRVVVTHHGPDYDRQKWGKASKFVLKLGERFGMCASNGRIVISQVIQRLVETKYGKSSALIPNGVTLPVLPHECNTLNDFGLTPGRYILLVSRLVPEKRHLDLIQAFQKAALPGWKLAIVGGADHQNAYSQQVLAAADSAIICTGFQSGAGLAQLYGHAGFFVLPSSHEGLPIAMLEALSYGLPVVASDIAANLEVGLPAENYFPLGDVDALAARLRSFAAVEKHQSESDERRAWVIGHYDWRVIAGQTFAVYAQASKA